MGIPLGSNFTVNTALPLDDRQQVADLTARDAISSARRWEGMKVYVLSEEKTYTLVAGITNSDWAEESGGTSVMRIVTKTAGFTASAAEADLYLVDTTSGNITAALPAAASSTGVHFLFKKTVAANQLTVDPNASETIDGQTTLEINTRYVTLGVVCDGTTWHII